jgi:hypothetical protein
VIPSTWLNDVNAAVYTTIPSHTTSIQTNATAIQALQTTVQGLQTTPASDATKQAISAKDQSDGYVGLTAYKINFNNNVGTWKSFLVNSNTAARTYTFPNKDITVAGVTGETFTKPIIKGYVEQLQQVSSGAAITVNPDNGTLIEVTVNANTTITLPAASAGLCYTLILIYSGAFTVAFAGGTTLKWATGVAPTATSTTNRMDKYVFTCGASYTLGQDGGRNF